MLNHEVAVEAIYEAIEVLTDVETGSGTELASEKALELMLLAMELDGDDKNAVYTAAHALDSVVNHPAFVDDGKAMAQAIAALNHLREQAAAIAAEAWVFADEDEDVVEEDEVVETSIEKREVESLRELMEGDWDDDFDWDDDDENENENENENESLYDLLASIDDEDDDFDWDDEDEGEGCGLDDVEYEYNNAMEAITKKLESLENKLFEYEYGDCKDDDDAYEQAYQLKADIRYARRKQTEIEDLLESFKSGGIDAWTAQDRIYKKVCLID